LISYPLISILIPNFNKGKYLKETLDSVLDQSYLNWECIVVDDHSTDNSWEILKEYEKSDSRFKVFKTPKHRKKGGNAARNYAFELSKGEYINWLDSDDLVSKNFFTNKLILFEANPILDFVYSDILEFTNSIADAKRMDRLNFYKNHKNFPLNYMIGDFWIQTGMPMFKRNYLDNQKKHFDEDLLMGQEAEFFVRLLLDDPYLKFCPSSFIYYRRNHNSYMTDFFRLPYEKKYLLTYPTFKLHLKEFRKKNKIDSEVLVFFRNVFNDMFLFLPVNSIQFWDLFLFGTKYNLFKGRFQGIKILGIRFLKVFKLV